MEGSVTVVTAPHDGKSLGIPPPRAKADLVLGAHAHFDHNCARLVQKPDAKVLSSPVMTVERGVRVEGTPAAHGTSGGTKRGQVTMFRFELDGFSFCHLGDLGHALDESQADKISEVDFLFVPVGDVFTIGPQTAKAVIESVRPRVAVPMHYRVPGLGIAIQPVQNFLQLCDQKSVVKL